MSRSAELTKYAANAMLATKISFMNELANIAERFGADIEKVRVGIGSDPRIGYHFIYPGTGYGGSCFPKDVRALARSAADSGYEAELLSAVEAVNNRQKRRLYEKMCEHYGDNLGGKTIALWGLSFKPRTDDMREAPSRTLMEALWARDVDVRAYDPEAMDEARRLYSEQPGLTLCDSAYDAVEGADALAIATEWQEFRSPDFTLLREKLADKLIFDGRNLYETGCSGYVRIALLRHRPRQRARRNTRTLRSAQDRHQGARLLRNRARVRPRRVFSMQRLRARPFCRPTVAGMPPNASGRRGSRRGVPPACRHGQVCWCPEESSPDARYFHAT